MRLIDVDKLKLELKWLEDDTPVYHDVMSTIDEMPTVDPVKHGHWKQGKNNFVYNIFDCFVCSKCGTAFPYKSPYCGECGAKMDGELEDEVT